ncbi:hypothetical protein BGX27_002673 [Mortierella sp. AM989]|nr:hypothetical protein BGX27_002673 [Mortierella sp. AM989]
MHVLNYTLFLLLVVFSAGVARATNNKRCPTIPLAHEVESTVEVKDPESDKTIRMPNGYLIAKSFNFSDVWFGAYYASYTTLPHILRQYNAAGCNNEANIMKLTERGAPLFASIIIEAIRHSNESTTPGRDDHDDHENDHRDNDRHHRRGLQRRDMQRRDLKRRDLLDDIKSWFRDTFGSNACHIFATAGVGSFLATARGTNSGGVGLTDDQLFFARAAMGYVPSDIIVYYSANFAPELDGIDLVTFAKSIYVRSKGTTRAFPYGEFVADTYWIVHQIKRVQQYESRGFNLASFANDYLYAYCKAGQSHWNNPFEVEARNTASSITSLLYEEVDFFDFWRWYGLKSILGFPLSTTITSSKWIPTGETTKELSFQYGSLEIRFPSKCYRVWTASDLQKRSAAKCNPNRPKDRIVCPPTTIPDRKLCIALTECRKIRRIYEELANAKTWTCIGT